MIAGRVLALALVAVAAAVAWRERTQPLPAEFRLVLGGQPYHARYDAALRRLDLGYGPDAGAGLPELRYADAVLTGDEPAQAAKDWLFERRPRLPRGRLELELMRLRPDDVRPFWLPWVEPPPAREPITVEVLNGSGRPGVASAAKKVLRLQGADVVSTGNSDVLETRTVVYDRLGRHENAQAVRRWLGCEAAAAVTRPDPKRLVDVDVTVSIADDCPLQ